MTASGIAQQAVEPFMARERQRFLAQNPKSVALAERAQLALFDGVPMHWMADWSTPCPLFVARAQGARFHDVDGHAYVDFCLGDTGSMFGHSPAPIARALAEQGARGLTTMLPGEDAIVAGELLAQRFGLPYWQVTTTATDANRFVLRWARAITGRKVVLVFDGCYHGTVDDALVRCRDGRTVHRSGLLGQAHDLTQFSRAVPFNDLQALERALAQRRRLRRALRAGDDQHRHGPAPSGLPPEAARADPSSRHAADHRRNPHHLHRSWRLYPRLEPRPGLHRRRQADRRRRALLGIFGCSAEMAERMAASRQSAQEDSQGHGHSGMGTTLSANALAMHCMRANLEEVMTDTAYAHMLPLAKRLAEGFRRLIPKHGLTWSVTELGARSEFQFCPRLPRDGRRGRGGLPRQPADGPAPVPDQPRHPHHALPQHDPVLPGHSRRRCGPPARDPRCRRSASCWPYPARARPDL